MELMFNSDDGGSEQVTVGAAAAANGTSQVCRSALIWTSAADVSFKIGTTDADSDNALLPANVMIPIPVNNTSLLRFYSVAGATVHIIYRN